jgi:hypothetical protein
LQEEDINKLVECMALNSASTSEEEESEASEVSGTDLDADNDSTLLLPGASVWAVSVARRLEVFSTKKV